jgi:hypothetical protein
MADNDVAIEGRIRSYLAESGGSVQDPGGRGLTDEMARAIGLDKPATLIAVLGQMEHEGVITREMRGLRTFRIALTEAGSAQSGAADAEPPTSANGSDPTAQLPLPAKAMSLREALSRKAAVPPEPVPVAESAGPDEPVAGGLAPDAGSVAADPPAAAGSAADPPAAGAPSPAADRTRARGPVTSSRAAVAAGVAPEATTDGADAAPPTKAVSLRDAISRLTNASPQPAAADQADAPPPPPQASGGRAVSLRDRLAARADANADPLADQERPRPSRSRFDSPRPTSAPGTSPPPVVRTIPPAAEKPGKRSAGPKAPTAEKAAKVRSGRRRPRLQLNLTPDVKAPPSKSMVTAIAVAVAGLVLIAVILVVIARGSTHHVPLSLTTPLSADGCAVVTPELASAAFGGPAGVPHFVLGDCVYDDGTHELIAAVYRQNAKALFDAGHSGNIQEIPGLGDGAYYNGTRLRVLKGSTLLEVALGPVPAAGPTPKLLELARAAVVKL